MKTIHERLLKLEAENKELRKLWIENEGDLIETRSSLQHRMQIISDGIIVSPRFYGKNDLIWAEVVPAGAGFWRRLLPWVGNYWYEVHTNTATLAYVKNGSGGGYTLSGCMRRAMNAVDELENYRENTNE